MKKSKIISFVVALLSVVALGIFMGNYMFKLMEGKSSQSSNNQNSDSASNTSSAEQGTVKILYGDKESASNTADFKQNIQSANNADAVQLKTQDPIPPTETANKQENASNTAKATNEALVFSPTGPRWFAYASTNGLNVREKPDTKSKSMFKVAKGTRGVVKEKKDGWSYIQWDFNKKSGWSIDDYLVQGPANIMENIVNKTANEKIENIKPEQLTQAKIEKEVEKSKTIVGIAKPASLTQTVITYTNGKDLPQKGIIVPAGGANIREAPNTQSNRLVKLPKGTTVGIKSVKQVDKYQWFEITYSNNSKTGWTREDNLKF